MNAIHTARLGEVPRTHMSAPRVRDVSGGQESAALARAEAQIQAREKALTSQAGKEGSSTRYIYTTGPNGKRYITGAVVTVATKKDNFTATQDSAAAQNNAPDINGLTPSEQETVRRLQEIDSDVRQHEAAHQAAGGIYAGAATFGYVRGPDGKNYAVSGQVPISTPATSDPEEAAKMASRVLAAATAPGGGLSGQDVAVAAQASANRATSNARARRSIATDAYDKQMDFSRMKGHRTDGFPLQNGLF